MTATSLTDQEFLQFQRLLYEIAGIYMTPAKKPLICGRLARRLRHHNLSTYGEYYRLITSGQDAGELQIAIDLLTTNETYFFREPQHFDFLRDYAATTYRRGHQFRVWSAACSSGEEPYSIAMVLDAHLRDGVWEVVGSDVSTRVLEKARTGLYPIEQAKRIPKPFLQRYCLKGIGSHEGTLLVNKQLRNQVQFMQINLNEPLPRLGTFNVIFLRNVMIYFDADTKRKVLSRLIPLLASGGYLLIGHSESLNGLDVPLIAERPSIYRKP
ncbi:MAG: protein-glutamate O-methyltransferase CheR [Gammaproteobacteria bacterium]